MLTFFRTSSGGWHVLREALHDRERRSDRFVAWCGRTRYDASPRFTVPAPAEGGVCEGCRTVLSDRAADARDASLALAALRAA